MEKEKKKTLVLLSSSLFVLLGVSYLYYQEPVVKPVKQAQEKEEEKEMIRVNLTINDGSQDLTLTHKLEEGSSLFDLMEQLRKKDKLKYEVTDYTYAQTVDSINGKENDEKANTTWVLYFDNSQIKKNLKEIIVQKNQTYRWAYEKQL